LKILVTGASGFIGNYLIPDLVQHDIEVLATSRSVDKARQSPWYNQVKYIPSDLGEARKDFFSFFEQPDMLIHLAWGGLTDYDDLIHIEKYVPLHYNFIKNMVDHGLQHLLVTGSCLEYGMQEGCLSEGLDTRPTTAYGLGKDTLRKYIQKLVAEDTVVYQWVRLFYVFGEGQRESSLFSQLNTAVEEGKQEFNMSGGEQLRDYLPVDKIAKYLTAIALQQNVQGIINCCSGKPVSVRKFVEDYILQRNSSIKLNLGYFPYSDYEPMAFWGNNRILQRILDAE
jgi:dTDP-6-deoxy-L-talose 4-dehydrogenase (NAD+)